MSKWQEIKNWETAEVVEFCQSLLWATEMSLCVQDAEWHAEGDVWKHTLMVIDQLSRLDAWETFSNEQRCVLLFCSLFHDAGKPATTVKDPETGRIRSPGHARKSVAIARRQLMDWECDFETREAICGLVRFHGRPPYLNEQSDPEREVIGVSTFANNLLLGQFALADTRGRKTKTYDRIENDLKLWEMVATEHHCLEKPYAFANDQARVLFYRKRLENLYYEPFENFGCTMTMMSGLPGAGKNRWLAENAMDMPVVSLDEIRETEGIDPTDNQGPVAQKAREKARRLLRNSQDFALNATNVSRVVRQSWISLAMDYGAKIRIVYIEPPLRNILEQNRSRPKSIPEAVILKLASKLEPPTLAEAHEMQTLVRQ